MFTSLIKERLNQEMNFEPKKLLVKAVSFKETRDKIIKHFKTAKIETLRKSRQATKSAITALQGCEGVVKLSILKVILNNMFPRTRLYSIWEKALLYNMVIAMKNNAHKLNDFVCNILTIEPQTWINSPTCRCITIQRTCRKLNKAIESHVLMSLKDVIRIYEYCTLTSNAQ